MFFHTLGGRRDPQENGLTSLRERKFAARAMLSGEREMQIARPHRGFLPDIDVAAAVAPRPRPPLIRRIAAAVRHVLGVAAGRQAAAILLSGTSAPPVGKQAAATYIGHEEEMS